MKSFLDRFKRRDPDERAPEVASERAGKAGAPAEKPAPAIRVVKAESKAPGSSLTPSPATKSPVTTVADSEVRLELGDFLHRIPQNLLRPGPHDVTTELRFDVAELSSLIARGQTSINLAELYARAPGIFRAEVRAEDNVEVRFPWQKLMSIVKAVGNTPVGKIGITQAAADALAQKLRSRRPTRSASPSSPASGAVAKPQPAVAQESAPGETGKSATRGRQPAWVNKSASGKAPVEGLAGATPSVDLEAPAKPNAVAQPVGSPPPDAQGGANQEELIRDRDAANLKYEEAKADFQRQMAALSEERETIAAERDRAITELERAREELAAKIKELAERQVAASATDTAAGVGQDALQQELAAKTSQLETLVGKVTALKASSEEKLAAVAQERDKALLELESARQELGAKLGELERQQALQAQAQSEAAEAMVAREALQQDLAALRASGEEKFATITREREAIAAERDKVVGELERARKELAEKIQQIEFQQSLDSKSGEDAARLIANREAAQKELSEKATELGQLRDEIAALKKSSDERFAAISAERETLAREHDKAVADREAARKELSDKIAQIEAQQNVSTRSGQETARLAAEREAFQKELATKTSELEALKGQIAILGKGNDERFAAIAQERDQVRADLESARKELAGKIHQLEELQQHALKGSEDVSRALAERDALQKQVGTQSGDLETLKKQVAALQKGSEERLAAMARERESIVSERDKVLADLKRVRHELADKIKQIEFQEGLGTRSSEEATRLSEERTRLQKELSDKVSQMEALAAEIAELRKNNEARQAALTKERDKILAELEAARAELTEKNRQIEFQQSLSAKSGEDAAKLVAARAELQKQLDERNGEIGAIKTELAGLRKGGGKKFAVISEERDKVLGDLRRARQELANKVEQIEFQQNLVAKSSEDTAKALAERAALEKNLAVRTDEFEALKKELAALTASSAQKFASLNAERDKLVADFERVRTDLTTQAEQIKRQEEAIVQSAGEVKKLSAERDSFEKQLGVKSAELDALKNQLAELNRTNEVKVASLAAEREKVIEDLNHVRKDLAERAAQLKHSEEQCVRNAAESAKLIGERDSLKKDLAEKSSRFGALETESAAFRQGSETKYAAVVAEREKIQADLQKARKELAQKIEQVEFQAGLATKSAEDTARLVAERDALKKDLVAKGADFEAVKAQLADLTRSSDEKVAALTSEHARIEAELQRAHQELAARNEKIGFQEELSARSAEDAAKLVSEREALRKEVAGKNSELESIKAELKLLRQGSGKKYAAIAAERDKVLADLKRTREELAGKVEQIELQQSLVNTSAEDSAKANADREALRKELVARTSELDSLQKALAALQKTSDEKAAEFARERAKTISELEQTRRNLEGKIAEVEAQQRLNAKAAEEAEKLTAEREALRKDLAAKVGALESSKTEIAALKKNSDEKLAAVTLEREALRKERDKITADFDAARQELAARLKEIETQQGLAARNSAEAAKLAAERQALEKQLAARTSEWEKLQADLTMLKTSSDEKLAAVTRERDKVVADFNTTRQELAAKLKEIETQRGLAERNSAEAAKLTAERQALEKQLAARTSEWEKLQADFALLKKNSEQKFATITKERDGIVKEREKVIADLESARGELAARLKDLESQRTLAVNTARESADLQTARGALEKQLAAKASELEKLQRETAALKSRNEERLGAITKERDEIAKARGVIAAELDGARKELASKSKELEEREKSVAKTIGERTLMEKELSARAAESDTLKKQLAALNRSSGERLTAASTERDKVLAELETARHEIAEKIKEVEAQQNLVARNREDVAKATAERDALRKELADRTAKFGALTSELATLKKENDEKLAALAQERDALVQQKSGLAEQLAAATESLATRQKTVVEVELSKKENQRQIEELQRRIMAFESSQRETAQELSRERETRIKAERSLAAAERARQEATALVESLRVETRREYEGAARKREAEFARAQQELQDRLGALTEAQQKTVSERDELAATIQKVREEAAASETAAKSAFWESRAVASLEEDIANYRARIKTLLLEREATAAATQTKIEALTREREEAAREAARISAVHAQAASAQKGTQEDLDSKFAALAKEKEEILKQLEASGQDHTKQAQELAAARAAVQTTEAAVADLRHQLDKLAGERDSMQADWEKLFAELEGVKAQAREEHEKFAREQAEIEKSGSAANGDLQRQIAELKNSLDVVTREQGGLQQKLATAQAEYAQALAKFDCERTAFAQTKTELESRVANAEREANEIVNRANSLASTVQAREAELRERDAEVRRLAEAHEQALAARDRDRELRSLTEAKDQELAQLTAELESVREEHKAQSAVFAREFKAVVKQRDEAVAAAESAQLDLQEKESALAREKAVLERAEVDVTARLEREVARLRRERDQLVRHRDELHTRVARMIEDQRQILDELAAQSIRQGPLPNDVIQKPREPREANVIEITAAEITETSEPEHGINLPRIHPLPIPPPNVRVL